MLLSFLNAFAYSSQVPWLHATYAVLGAILFTLVGVKHPPCVISCGCFCGSLLIPSTVPGVRHSDVAREQALHHKPRGIHICHPQHLPGHCLPVQLPAADLGRRTRVTLPGQPVHRMSPTTSRFWFFKPIHEHSPSADSGHVEIQPFWFLHLTKNGHKHLKILYDNISYLCSYQ